MRLSRVRSLRWSDSAWRDSEVLNERVEGRSTKSCRKERNISSAVGIQRTQPRRESLARSAGERTKCARMEATISRAMAGGGPERRSGSRQPRAAWAMALHPAPSTQHGERFTLSRMSLMLALLLTFVSATPQQQSAAQSQTDR